MTQITPRLKIAILRSSLPDKALISAIENAGKPVTAASAMASDSDAPPKRRTYRRRDMKAGE